MSETLSKSEALNILYKDADNIRYSLSKQRNFLCLTDCPAFEEVADTKIYGLTCEVKFAVNCGLLSPTEGQALIKDLENDLDQMRLEALKDKKGQSK